MHLERLELAFGTLDEGCLAINEVEDVHTTICVVFYRTREGVPTRLDELVGMQASPLFLDVFLFMKHLEMVRDFCFHEGRCTFPLDDVLASLYIDGTRFAVESESSPVPQLEGEDAGRRADFEHHAVCARAMNRACRDEVVVVLLRRQLVDVFLCVEKDFAPLCSSQVLNHLHLVHALLQAQKDHRIFACIKQIVALILRVGKAELLLRELVSGMNLQAEVAALHRVEEVEADGETLAEASPDLLAEQLAAMSQHDILRRQLEEHALGFEIEAILLGHAVEAPAEIGFFSR